MRRWWTFGIPVATVAALMMLSLGALPVVMASPSLPRPFEVSLKSRRFVPNPGRDQSVVQSLTRIPGRAVHALVQFDHDLSSVERAALAKAGVTLLGYVPDRTYFVALSGKADLNSPAMASARWIGAIEPGDRLDQSLRTESYKPWAVRSDGMPLVIVRFFADIPVSQAEAILKQTRADVQDSISSLNAFVAALPPQGIEMLAREDAVQWIEPVMPALGPADVPVRRRVGADQLNVPPFNLMGAGIRILVYDSGLVDQFHLDLWGRVIWQSRESNSVPKEHSTKVGGMIAGNGTLSKDKGDIQGIAPQAFLFSEYYRMQSEGPLFYNNPGNIEEAYLKGLHNGATLVNASLGMNVGGSNNYQCSLLGIYEATAALLDGIVRGDWSGGQPLTVIWAAGNERNPGYSCRAGSGLGYRTIAPPASAKNPIVVGATYVDDGQMTDFSSWGSLEDGRLKPDLVAPGDNRDKSGFITTIPNNSYDGFRGTSAAAPVVTGITALMLERYHQLYPNHQPLPSTLKALLINTARDQEPGPDFAYGYGEVDGLAAVNAVDAGEFIEGILDGGPGVNVFRVLVGNNNPKLQVTLAWDDVASVPNSSGPNLVNDLDLVLIDPDGRRYDPWVLDPSQPQQRAQPGANHLDNVEQVTVVNPLPGTWTVRVYPFRVPYGPQRYSLAVSGATMLPTQAARKMHISNLAVGSRRSGSRYQLVTMVTVVNSTGAPVPGAVVELRMTGPGGAVGPIFVTTDSNGNATATTVAKVNGRYNLWVENISHATFDRDMAADVMRGGFITVPR